MKDLNEILGMASRVQEELQRAQDNLDKLEVEGAAGGGDGRRARRGGRGAHRRRVYLMRVPEGGGGEVSARGASGRPGWKFCQVAATQR